MEILRGLLLFLFIILLGVFLFKASIWSRRKNDQMQKSGEDSPDEIMEKIMNGDNFKTEVPKFLASSLPKKDEIFGKVLAIAVILLVTTFLLVVAYKGI